MVNAEIFGNTLFQIIIIGMVMIVGGIILKINQTAGKIIIGIGIILVGITVVTGIMSL